MFKGCPQQIVGALPQQYAEGSVLSRPQRVNMISHLVYGELRVGQYASPLGRSVKASPVVDFEDVMIYKSLRG